MSDGPLPDTQDLSEGVLDDALAAGAASAMVWSCPNCRKAAQGAFCPQCGQKHLRVGDLSIKHAWHHVVHELFHLDGKVFNSLRLLFTKPGQLTVDFLEGRRAKHVHPVRLFIVFGLVFFFVAKTYSPVDPRALIDERSKASFAKLSERTGYSITEILGQAHAITSANFKAVDICAILVHGVLLWVMFRRRRPYLAENMVTALHIACFGMALWVIFGSLSFLDVSRTVISLLILSLAVPYFVLTLRRVYGTHWTKALLAWLVLQLSTAAIIAVMIWTTFFLVVRQALANNAPPVVRTSVAAPAQSQPLFDGRSLGGLISVSRELPTASGQPSPWTVVDGALRHPGKPIGYLRSASRYENYRLSFEWRWPVRIGNAGVFLHLNGEDRIWPRCVEIQLRAGQAGALRPNTGAAVNEVKAPDRQTRLLAAPNEKPPGEWNRAEVVCRGDTITVTINGVLQAQVTGSSEASGFIALQAEFEPIEYRNIVVAPLP